MNLDELLKCWRTTRDEMIAESLVLQERIDQLQMQLAELQAPYRGALSALEAEIRAGVIALGSTYKSNSAEARFRKGSRRISYNWRQVDAVASMLRDVLPETADTLTAARKESVGKPSVTIVKVQEKA